MMLCDTYCLLPKQSFQLFLLLGTIFSFSFSLAWIIPNLNQQVSYEPSRGWFWSKDIVLKRSYHRNIQSRQQFQVQNHQRQWQCTINQNYLMHDDSNYVGCYNRVMRRRSKWNRLRYELPTRKTRTKTTIRSFMMSAMHSESNVMNLVATTNSTTTCTSMGFTLNDMFVVGDVTSLAEDVVTGAKGLIQNVVLPAPFLVESISLGKVTRIRMPGDDDDDERSSFVRVMSVPTFKCENGTLSALSETTNTTTTATTNTTTTSKTISASSSSKCTSNSNTIQVLEWFEKEQCGPALLVSNVLSRSTCEDIIRTCEGQGSSKSNIEYDSDSSLFRQYNSENSNNSKNNHGALQLIVTEEMANVVADKLKPFINYDQLEQRRHELLVRPKLQQEHLLQSQRPNQDANDSRKTCHLNDQGGRSSAGGGDADCLVFCGLNRRWRIYRYQPNGVEQFAPHIDAGFPPSGLSEDGNEMVWDVTADHLNFHENNSQPKKKKQQLSRLTVLLYLNDDFLGGETNFYLPKYQQEMQPPQQSTRYNCTNNSQIIVPGSVDCDTTNRNKLYTIIESVKPVAGSCLMFPQAVGDDDAIEYARRYWPLHEGSKVYDCNTNNDKANVSGSHRRNKNGSPNDFPKQEQMATTKRSLQKSRPKYVIRSDVLFQIGHDT